MFYYLYTCKEFIINTLSYEICYSARKVYNYVCKYYEKYDITPEQFVIVEAINKEEGLSQKDVASALDKDQNTVKAITDILVRKGWVIKKVNKNDRRAFSLYLTDFAKNKIADLYAVELEVNAKLSQLLSQKEVDDLCEGLTKVRVAITQQN